MGDEFYIMNIFYLHKDPEISAKMHCDKHVVKMIIEYAQLMSTAHRILDGDEYEGRTKIGRRIRRWKHPNKNIENTIYKASHINHPSAVWVEKVLQTMFGCIIYLRNYVMSIHLDMVRYILLMRYSEIYLYHHPKIKEGGLTTMPQAMPDHCKKPDSVDAYRTYYIQEKKRFAKWTKRDVPEWFEGA